MTQITAVHADASMGARREIPFFNYRQAFASREEDFVEVFRSILRRGAFIQQSDLITFEHNLAAFLGVKHAIGVANATDGLHMAWRVAGLRPGDHVLFPSHTMVATPAAVHFAGGVPVPVECGPDHLIDPVAIERALTDEVRGICPVQLNGRTARMDDILALAAAHELIVIEDAAQALGSRFRGQCAGTFGRAGVFSFYPAKVLACAGDGGAIVTNDDDMAEQLRLMRDHGRDSAGAVRGWGLNSRLDNLQAALLDLQLQDYTSVIALRRSLAQRYTQNLRAVPQLMLPPAPDDDGDHFDVYQNYEIEAERRDALRAHLSARGIGTLIQWGGRGVHQFPELGLHASLPVTEQMFERCLMLPMNTTLSVDDVDHISQIIRDFYEV